MHHQIKTYNNDATREIDRSLVILLFGSAFPTKGFSFIAERAHGQSGPLCLLRHFSSSSGKGAANTEQEHFSFIILSFFFLLLPLALLLPYVDKTAYRRLAVAATNHPSLTRSHSLALRGT